MDDFPSQKPPFTRWISQLAQFDDTEGYQFEDGRLCLHDTPRASSFVPFVPCQGLERPPSRARRKGCCGRCMQINSESLSWNNRDSPHGLTLHNGKWTININWLWLKIRVQNDPQKWSFLVGKPSSYWGLIILSHSQLMIDGLPVNSGKITH